MLSAVAMKHCTCWCTWLTSVKQRDSFGEEVFVGDLVSVKDANELIGGHSLVAGVNLHHRPQHSVSELHMTTDVRLRKCQSLPWS